MTITRPYSLVVNHQKDKVHLEMRCNFSLTNTSRFVDIGFFIKSFVPSVFKTRCFNKTNLPFKKEVLHTELGHFFEHILLDQLCALTVEQRKNLRYRGLTKWNWTKEKKGIFHIYIDCRFLDKYSFNTALKNSKFIFNKLISSSYPLSQFQ